MIGLSNERSLERDAVSDSATTEKLPKATKYGFAVVTASSSVVGAGGRSYSISVPSSTTLSASGSSGDTMSIVCFSTKNRDPDQLDTSRE